MATALATILLMLVVAAVIALLLCFRWTKKLAAKSNRKGKEGVEGYEESEQLRIIDNEAHILVDRIVELFQYQRVKDSEFAVILLSSHHCITRDFIFRTRMGAVDQPDTATNCHTQSFPLPHSLSNYLAARTDGRTHAVVALMNRFPLLMRSYNVQHSHQCRTIMLYTWLFPCYECKQAIIDNLQPYTEKSRVIVVYTSTLCDLDENEIRAISYEMELAGMTVRQERYDYHLQPTNHVS